MMSSSVSVVIYILFHIYLHIVIRGVHMPGHAWLRLADDLGESIFSFYHVGTRDHTWVGIKDLCPLSRLNQSKLALCTFATKEHLATHFYFSPFISFSESGVTSDPISQAL